MDRFDEAYAAVDELVRAEFPEMGLDRGVELMLDSPGVDLSDPRVRLGGSMGVLVEFPSMVAPAHGVNALYELRLAGWRTVLAHPERYQNVRDMTMVREWKNVGCLLRGTKRDEIERGQVLCKQGSITPHTKFKAEVYILKKEEGGRHTPFFTGYRPQFYFRTTDVTGVANLPEGVEMVMPGDNVTMEIELIQPIAMDQGLRFAIREGGRTVGSGIVAEVVE